MDEESDIYTFRDDFVLSEENGFSDWTYWIMETKVWGPEQGEGEVIESSEFLVVF